MSDLRKGGGVLVDANESHDGRPHERDRPSEVRLPRLRGWQVIEEISVGSEAYVLLRRLQVPKTGFESLTTREIDAVRHACTGASTKEIAHRMCISPSTAGVLLWRATRKIGASDREGLIRYFTMQRL